jgi:hypothetical protein
MAFTTHPHLAQRLRMSEAINPHPLCALCCMLRGNLYWRILTIQIFSYGFHTDTLSCITLFDAQLKIKTSLNIGL